MHPTGIVAALRAEARALGPLVRAPGRRAGRSGLPGRDRADGLELGSLADGSLLAVCGMGGDAAVRGAQALAEAGCAALVSWGLAGALDPALAAGTIILPEAILLDGARTLGVTAGWREQALRALAGYLERGRGIREGAAQIAGGTLLTSRHALVSAAEKQAAFRRSGAAAVDMESHAVAEVAASRGMRFLAVRVIVDAARDEVPPALGAAVNGDGRVAAGKLAAALIAAPGTLVPLLRLAGRYRAARRSLRAIAHAGALGA